MSERATSCEEVSESRTGGEESGICHGAETWSGIFLKICEGESGEESEIYRGSREVGGNREPSGHLRHNGSKCRPLLNSATTKRLVRYNI